MTMLRLLGVVGVVAMVAACGDAPPPPAPAAAAVAPKPKPVAPPTPASSDGGTTVADAYIYSYNPVGKRDPFRSPIEEGPKGGPIDNSLPTCSEPLCQYDLEQLALVAVVSGDANPVAMLEDPNQVGHIVHRNSKAGKQGGKVTQILRDCIVVTEYFTAPDGKKNPNRVNICTKKDTSQKKAYDLLNNQAVE